MKITNTLLIIFSLVLFSCTKSHDLKENKIKVALLTDIPSIDPMMASNVTSTEVLSQTYETLFQYNYLIRPYQLEPLLSDGMPKISDDGLTYTIKIKKNIYYHPHPTIGDKRKVMAEDFITTIKRIAFKGSKSTGFWLFKDKIKGLDQFREQAGVDFEKFKTLEVSGLKAIDKQTLSITLKKPYRQFLFTFAMIYTSPMPMETVVGVKNTIADFMVGTGPFILKDFKPNLHVKFDRFKKYRDSYYPYQGDRLSYEKKLLVDAGKRIPFVDGINFFIMKESQTQWLNFLQKKIDYIILSKDHFEAALDENGKLKKEYREQGIQMQIAPTMTYWWLSFNMDDPLIGQNKNLRKAIAHAIDINKYLKVFTHNIGLEANSIYCPGIAGYKPTNELPFKYDMEKAKEFLKKAGYPEGKGLPALRFDTRGNRKISVRMSEYVKTELEKIGIKVDITINPYPIFLKKAREGKLQMWQGGWAMDYPDPENMLQLLISKNTTPGPNTANYSNPQFDNLFDQVNQLQDGPEKEKILGEMNSLINEDLPWIMQYYTRNYILYHSYLKNFRQSDIIYNHFKYIKLNNEK